ncbi:hypothetical protein BP6252_04584 [Coleophoma cylindrospora]|uniref:Uncharacterized protein n=1 Tax=Coleophoma cylindrospora TaxID=1849047 RepID=A0A3D8S102_9HELO|nr:hypothetical protein BP6252_04584 [Coleophoma cylindrospora]
MPSFSFLKHPRSDSRQEVHDDGDANLSSRGGEKVQRRMSKRDFFRNLLKKPSVHVKGRDSRRQSVQVKTPDFQSPSTESAVTPASPMSDPNKPLPPTPPEAEIEEAHALKSPLKLDRIIAPVSSLEVHKLFSGAPQFFDRAEGHHTGAPRPMVAFPWDEEVAVRDLCDHLQIQDAAWGSVTAARHITRDRSNNPAVIEAHQKKKLAHYQPRCRERPLMLSMQGIERGTMGFVAALELGVADAQNEEEDFQDEKERSLVQRRRDFVYSKDGLRPFSESMLVDHLSRVTTNYDEDPFNTRRTAVEMYTELFTQLLYPPSRVTDSDDPYSLQVQIEALLDVLGAPGIWIDFSIVEWRIRLGQILWGPQNSSYEEDGVSINSEESLEPGAEKFWLLLQILLACELSIRLDAECQNIDLGKDSVRAAAIQRFDKQATESVKWSMILARQWLEDIQIESVRPRSSAEQKASSGWLATLKGAKLPHIAHGNTDSIDNIQIRGRYQQRQLSGLLHFARKLQWPNVEHLAGKVASNGISMSESIQSTPAAGTPMSSTTQRSSSYFTARRPTIRRGISRPQKISSIMNPTGWLSNSYLSGLVLPGEGMSHFLISTLLENDEIAVARLGEEANLYGGFIFFDKSFWSMACIVGRVLAAGKGARECMGWVSSDVTPRGCGEGWVNIDIEAELPSNLYSDYGKPRIWEKIAVERDGNVIGDSDSSSVLPGDFVIPSDKPAKLPLITLESLDFFAAVDSGLNTPTHEYTPYMEMSEASQIKTYSAMVRFSVAFGEEVKELHFALTHNIHFVTAHPCVPSNHTETLHSISSPTSPIFVSGTTGTLSGHPLHKFFSYTQVALSTILSSPSKSYSTLVTPDDSLASELAVDDKPSKVLIIDCTSESEQISTTLPTNHKHHFGNDMEVLVRALCAEKGWNALISRRGRGCIACAVREAGALGWGSGGVIVRL